MSGCGGLDEEQIEYFQKKMSHTQAVAIYSLGWRTDLEHYMHIAAERIIHGNGQSTRNKLLSEYYAELSKQKTDQKD